MCITIQSIHYHYLIPAWTRLVRHSLSVFSHTRNDWFAVSIWHNTDRIICPDPSSSTMLRKSIMTAPAPQPRSRVRLRQPKLQKTEAAVRRKKSRVPESSACSSITELGEKHKHEQKPWTQWASSGERRDRLRVHFLMQNRILLMDKRNILAGAVSSTDIDHIFASNILVCTVQKIARTWLFFGLPTDFPKSTLSCKVSYPPRILFTQKDVFASNGWPLRIWEFENQFLLRGGLLMMFHHQLRFNR